MIHVMNSHHVLCQGTVHFDTVRVQPGCTRITTFEGQTLEVSIAALEAYVDFVRAQRIVKGV